MDSLIRSSWNTCTSVWIGCLFAGGVLIILKSLAPIKLKCSVLGIGVAVKVKQSTLVLKVFNFSLCPTPNFCSSSITINPRSLKCTSFPRIPCVPTNISILPSFTLAIVSFFCAADLNRFKKSISIGKSLSLSLKVLKC